MWDAQNKFATVDDAVMRVVAGLSYLGVGDWSYGRQSTIHISALTTRLKVATSRTSISNMPVVFGPNGHIRDYEAKLVS